MIYEQGVNLNIAAQTIKSAKQKFKDGRAELVEANSYQQDTSRTKMYMCIGILIVLLVIMMIIWASSKNRQ